MKTLILAFFSLFLQGNGQINYNLNPFAGFQPLQPIRPLINRPDLQNGFGSKFERNKRSPQFHQNYQPGSQSQNFNCRYGGCGNIPGMQQIHGGNVHNSGGNFNQNYFGGSQATNYGRKKREVDEEVEEAKITTRTKTNPTELLESLPELTDTKNCFCKVKDVEVARQFFTVPSRPSQVRGTVLCTYPNGLPACKCMCDPFTIINPNPTYTSTSWPSYPQTYPQRYPGFHQTFLYGRKKRETTEPIKTELFEDVIEVSDNPADMKCSCSSDQGIKMPGTVLCTYPGGKVSCKCTCKPFTIIEVDYTRLYPVVQQRSANPQFNINYEQGSSSMNYDCKYGGCGNIPATHHYHGGQVTNHGTNYNQDYHYGSHATNIGRKKRSPQFFQSFAPGSTHVNCDHKGCGPAQTYPGTTSMATQFANFLANLNPFASRPQQAQQVQPAGFMHFGDIPQLSQETRATLVESE